MDTERSDDAQTFAEIATALASARDELHDGLLASGVRGWDFVRLEEKLCDLDTAAAIARRAAEGKTTAATVYNHVEAAYRSLYSDWMDDELVVVLDLVDRAWALASDEMADAELDLPDERRSFEVAL